MIAKLCIILEYLLYCLLLPVLLARAQKVRLSYSAPPFTVPHHSTLHRLAHAEPLFFGAALFYFLSFAFANKGLIHILLDQLFTRAETPIQNYFNLVEIQPVPVYPAPTISAAQNIFDY